MIRLEEEIMQSVSGNPLLWALNKLLDIFNAPTVKRTLELTGRATGILTSNTQLCWILAKILSSPTVDGIMDKAIDGGIDTLDGLSAKVKETVGISLEDLLERGMLTMFRVPGVSEGVWLLTIGLRPIMQNIEPEFFAAIMGVLMNDKVKLKALPMILSIAAPLLQVLMASKVFEHLGELEGYTEEGFDRYIGKEV